MPQRILVATDFSTASASAVRHAIAACRKEKAALLIAHVLEPPVAFTMEGYVLPRMYDDLAAAVRGAAEKRMRRLIAVARKAGVRARGLLLTGLPHEAVVRAARSHKAGQLVVGTHGRSGWSRLVLGSVASRIIASAPCPVLVVPATKSKKKGA
jgi:nucleotide-binding universal stress UspA family protein